MSFSYDTKLELAKKNSKNICCTMAECYGIWLFSRAFTLKERHYISENPAVTTKMAELAAGFAGVETEIQYAVSRRKKAAYKISLVDIAAREKLLAAFGATGKETNLRINQTCIKSSCCYSTFLRGAFLSCGSVTDPKSEYHLEFVVQYKKLSEDLLNVISSVEGLDLSPAISLRKGSYIVYLKDSRQIEDFLTFLGAESASMALMQVKMYKEMKNDINRKANFETANMDKTYSASAKQIAAIAKITDSGILGELPNEIRQLAQLRLNNPEMTLRELSESLGITRSATNHRIKKILEIGDKLGDDSDIKIV